MLNHRLPHISPSPPQSAPSPSGPPSSAGSLLDTSRVAPPADPALPASSAAPVSSAVLLRGNKTVDIAHNGMLYTLQATKLGKLILTK